MSKPVILRGYRYSVYNRIAAMVLREKGVSYGVEEVDPFTPPLPTDYQKRHPFGRVPVLSHGAVDIYETSAIARYIDAAFEGPALTPDTALGQARMTQVIGIIDNYGYVPMIRQVFAHRVFRPAERLAPDENLVREGIAASEPVLAALNNIAVEGEILSRAAITLADCHLAPMLAYFTMASEGREALARHQALNNWWDGIATRPSLMSTDPGLPNEAAIPSI